MIVLSDVELSTPQMRREIVFEGGAIHVRLVRQGSPAGGFHLLQRDAGVLAFALEECQRPAAKRQLLGRFANFEVYGAWIRNAPALAIQKVAGDGTEYGRPTVLFGEEIPALWRGLDLLLGVEVEP